jgi:hypothetical protein
MSKSRVFEDYAITTQLMEESGTFYLQFYNTEVHKKYEATVAYDTLGLPGKPAEVFNVLNYCLDKKEGYNFGFALNGPIMGVGFDALLGGVLSVSFAFTLKETAVSIDTVISYKLNELETELKEVKDELETTKEQLVNTKDELETTKEELETTRKVLLKHLPKIQLYDVNIVIDLIYDWAPGYNPATTCYTIQISRSGKVYIAKKRVCLPNEWNTVLLDLPHGKPLPDYLLSMFKILPIDDKGNGRATYTPVYNQIIDSMVKCITEFNSNSACI